MTDVRGCFEKGYLKEIPPSKGLAIKSLRQARFFIEETEDLINLNKEEMAVISLYNAFFHISRSILFRDGVKERSHFCLARYIEERYVSKGTVSEIFLKTI